MKKNLVEIALLIIYLAVVFTLARPGSQGPVLIRNIGEAISGVINAATGGGTDWGPAAPTGPTLGVIITPIPRAGS